MTKEDIRKIARKFQELTVPVVGDVFLDKYTHGLVRGTSKETPVPLYEFEQRIIAPGAAGNVASNFAALGATVFLLGLIGDDDDGKTLVKALKKNKVKPDKLIILKSLPTNTYEKIIARAPNGQPQELLLVRTLMPENGIVTKARTRIVSALRRVAKSLDAVVVVDQVAHLFDKDLLRSIPKLCRQMKILSVGNSRHQIHLCKGFDLLVVNELEAAQGTGIPPTAENFNRLGKALLPQARKAVLLTIGPDGTRLFEKNSPPLHHPSVARTIVDITGAGDTALAAYVCARLSKLPPCDALLFSNAAAAVAIAKPGTATATLDEITNLV